jgi:hypothetical protein
MKTIPTVPMAGIMLPYALCYRRRLMTLRFALIAALTTLPIMAEASSCRLMQWHPEMETCPSGSKHDPITNRCIG